MNIILLGLPGSGKGTQARLISNRFEITHLSVGEILRKSIKNMTPIGLKVSEYVNSGKLVPDEIVIELVNNRITNEDCQDGFILDGYPRTIVQAKNLIDMLNKEGKKINKVIYLKVDQSILLERISGRRVSLSSGKEYHVKFNPPKVEGKCDIDNSDLIQRKDDKPEKIQERIKVYNDMTKPLIKYFKDINLLYEIIADKNPNEVSQTINSLFEGEVEQQY